jgi:hypothetical protein
MLYAMAKIQPVRLDAEEEGLIEKIQKKTKPRPSVSFVLKRALRFAAPKILRGEVPMNDEEPSTAKH